MSQPQDALFVMCLDHVMTKKERRKKERRKASIIY
jgi:hypothetical protein